MLWGHTPSLIFKERIKDLIEHYALLLIVPPKIYLIFNKCDAYDNRVL